MFDDQSWQDRTKRRLINLLRVNNPKVDAIHTSNAAVLVCNPNDGSIAGPDTHTQEVIRPLPTAMKEDHIISGGLQPSNKPTVIELDEIQWGQRLDGPDQSGTPTPAELEDNSRPNSPARTRTHEVNAITQPTISQPCMNKWRIAVLCLSFFTQGFNDSAPGALLPSMEQHYQIKYAIVSLIFVGNAIGFIVAAPICHLLNNRFGRAKVLSVCALLNTVAYAAIVCQPPWPVVVIAFLVLGFGFATVLALNNVFIINLQRGTVILGYIVGLYGIGGTCSPFIATAMLSSGIRWSTFYAILMTLSFVNSILYAWSFRGYEQELVSAQLQTILDRSVSQQTSTQEKASVLRRAIKNRTTLLGALMIFAYQGAEVSISGWVISFLIDYRNGDPSQVGYVTSGFWGGITLGRFILTTPAHKIGDRLSVFILVALSAAFQFMVWFLPNVIGNAVAVALIGFLLGPIWPLVTGVFSRLLPSHLQLTSLGFISSMGSSGGAIAPFFTGILSQKLGTVVLNPICIALCVVMELAWFSLPREVKRTE